MKNVLITGATGMVGSKVLKELLKNNEVRKIISIGRTKTGISDAKLTEIKHADFLDYSGLKETLRDLDTCFYCLSVYQSQVNKAEYKTISCDYQKALTDVLQVSSPGLTFVLHGAAGADPSEKSRILFARVKGKAENLLNATSFPKKYIFRPGHIQPTGMRKPPGKVYRFMLPLIGFMFKLIPSLGTTDSDLGKVMMEIGLQDKLPSQIFENSQIRKQIDKT